MKKSIIISLFCLMTINLINSQNVVDISETISKEVDGQFILFSKYGEKFTGIVLSNWSNKELASSKTYKDGKLNGLYKEYYSNGSLKFYGNFKNDKKHGLCRWYYKNGCIESKGNFNDGNPIELFEWYYENCKLKQKSIIKNGEYSSTQTFPENKKFTQQNVSKYESLFPIPLKGWKALDVIFDLTSPELSYFEGILLSRVYTQIKTNNQIEISIDTGGDTAALITILETMADTIADFTNSDKKEAILKFKHQNYEGFKTVNKKEEIIEVVLVINFKVAFIISAKNQNIDKDVILNYLKSTNIYKIEESFKLSLLDLF